MLRHDSRIVRVGCVPPSLPASFLPLHISRTHHPVSSVFCVAALRTATCAQWSATVAFFFSKALLHSPATCPSPLYSALASAESPLGTLLLLARAHSVSSFLHHIHHSSYHESGFLIFPLAHALPHFRYVDVHNRPPPRAPRLSALLLLSSSSTTPRTNYDCFCCYYYRLLLLLLLLYILLRLEHKHTMRVYTCVYDEVCAPSAYVLAVNTSCLRSSLPP